MCNLKYVPLWLSPDTLFVQTNYSTSKRRGCNCTVFTPFSWQLIGLLLQPKTDCFIKHKTNCGGWWSNHSRWDHTKYNCKVAVKKRPEIPQMGVIYHMIHALTPGKECHAKDYAVADWRHVQADTKHFLCYVYSTSRDVQTHQHTLRT